MAKSEAPLRPGAARLWWDDLPLLNFVLYGVGIAFAEIANLSPSRPDLFFTCLCPIAVPIAVYGLRWRQSGAAARRVAVGVVTTAVLLLALIYLTRPVSPIDLQSLRAIYEASAILNAVVLAGHAARRGRRVVALFFGPAALYGLLLENGGILLGYFAELDYRIYLGPLPAPLATLCGWITVFYLVIWVAAEVARTTPWIARSPLCLAGIATLAALALDLQIDPLATAVGFWTWHPLLPRGPLGVPILNFVAWSAAVLPFAWLLFWRRQRFGIPVEALGERAHVLWLAAMVPAVLAAAAVLFLTVMTAVDGGLGPTYAVLRATFIRVGVLAPDATWAPGD
ncbi:MAG: carotenoid biosynthesis protein [Deltaproteobacteria bacterium]|nr:carotenoid biosynthesis protein [Deltaproteobacteria bacterium]